MASRQSARQRFVKHYKMVVAFLTPNSISLSLVRNISTSIEENLEMRVSECRSFRNMKNLERLSIILMTKRHLQLQGAVHKNLGTVQSSSVHTKPVNQLTETPSFWNRSRLTKVSNIFFNPTDLPIREDDWHRVFSNSMTLQAWKMKFLNFMTFQVFHDLYEPCSNLVTYTDHPIHSCSCCCGVNNNNNSAALNCLADEVLFIFAYWLPWAPLPHLFLLNNNNNNSNQKNILY